MTCTEESVEAVRLALPADYPADHLIGIETHVPTGERYEDSFDVVVRTLGDTVPQGSLFAYLFRRFGHPNKSSDPDKNLVSYLLTTTSPDMLLRITPYAGGDTSISFEFMVPHHVRSVCDDWMSRSRDAHRTAFHDWIEAEDRVPEWADELIGDFGTLEWPLLEGVEGWRRMMTPIAILAYPGVRDGDSEGRTTAIRWYEGVRDDFEALFPVPAADWRKPDVDAWDDADPLKPIVRAMEETLRDLLRPVWIRDTAIGIHGRIDEDDLDDQPESAESAPSAGFPLGMLGNEDPNAFAALIGAVLALDPDRRTAILRATAMLTTPVADGTAADQNEGSVE
jgi:hypothetical protein